MKSGFVVSALISVLLLSAHAYAQQAELPQNEPQYEEVPPQPMSSWNLWISDGPARVYSENSSWGNRFQLGVDANLLKDHRLIAGITAFDLMSSGESSTDVGGISRTGFDLRLGYFLIPHKIFIEYGLYLGGVSGSRIYNGYWGWWGQGWTSTVGHSASLGWKLFNESRFSMALIASYQFIGSQTISTFDVSSNQNVQATYPRANIYSLNVRFDFDLGS